MPAITRLRTPQKSAATRIQRHSLRRHLAICPVPAPPSIHQKLRSDLPRRRQLLPAVKRHDRSLPNQRRNFSRSRFRHLARPLSRPLSETPPGPQAFLAPLPNQSIPPRAALPPKNPLPFPPPPAPPLHSPAQTPAVLRARDTAANVPESCA